MEKDEEKKEKKEPIFCLLCDYSTTEYKTLGKHKILPEHKANPDDEYLCPYGDGNSFGYSYEEKMRTQNGE